MAAGFPHTWFIPSEDELLRLKEGNQVKVLFQGPTRSSELITESLWVLVTKKVDDKWEGVLEDTPTRLSGLKVGQSIQFQGANVRDIVGRLVTPWELVCRSSCLVECGVGLQTAAAAVYLATRVPLASRIGPDDSGWRFCESPKPPHQLNFQQIPLGVVLNRFPELVEFVREGKVGGLRKSKEDATWMRVPADAYCTFAASDAEPT